MKRSKVFLLVLFSFIWFTLTTKIQCENQSSDWQSRKELEISSREMLVSTKYAKVDVIIDSQDALVSTMIRSGGSWEPKNLRTMARFVTEGNTILNIGSHIGLEAIVLGKIVGPKGRLFIMEPYSVSYNIVLKNVYLNGLGDIATVYNVGAGDRETNGSIVVSTSNTEGSEIFTDNTIRRAPLSTEIVRVDLVDDVIPSDAVIDFALIDVERMEIQCLNGMKQAIARSPNIVIMCQWSGYSFNSRNFEQKKKSLIDWLTEQHFKFYQISSIAAGGCRPEIFSQLDPGTVSKTRSLQDIFIIPSHIDPNNVF